MYVVKFSVYDDFEFYYIYVDSKGKVVEVENSRGFSLDLFPFKHVQEFLHENSYYRVNFEGIHFLVVD